MSQNTDLLLESHLGQKWPGSGTRLVMVHWLVATRVWGLVWTLQWIWRCSGYRLTAMFIVEGGFFFFLFIFYCAGSLLLRGLFFSYRGRGLLSLQWLLFMWNTGSRAPSFSSWGMSAQYICGSWVLEHRLCCSAECGIFLDQGSNPCLLPWQADSLPLSHKGSPRRGSWRESWILTWLPEPFIQLCNLRIMPGVSFSLISVTQSIGIFLDHFIS